MEDFMKLLIVVDMQNDFVTGSLGTKEAQAIVENVICKIKETPAEQIYVTQDTHPEQYLQTKEGHHLPVALRERMDIACARQWSRRWKKNRWMQGEKFRSQPLAPWS